VAKTEKSGCEQLPKELNEMKIKDDKSKNNNEKVFIVINLFYFSYLRCFYIHWGVSNLAYTIQAPF
jgi:hypothetical protein